MAQYISFQPSGHFSTKIWTGTGSTNAITGVGFSPSFVWIKNRSTAYDHHLYDVPRGVTEALAINDTGGETTKSTGLTAFDADGFTVGADNGVNKSADNIVSWNWKMGTTTGLTGGTITPTAYSLNTTARQSIIAYTGTTAVATIPHGLGVKPDLIITKQYDTGRNWSSYWAPLSAEEYLIPNTTAAAAAGSTFWAQTEPTSTVFSVGSADETNGTGTMVAYCFANTTGYSKIGAYTGTGNVNGAFIHCGFRPAFIIRKKDGTEYWSVIDDKRLGYNPKNAYLFPSDDGAENAAVTRVDILSNGFKLRTTDGADNADGEVYVYAAFAEFPFVSSNSKPGTAR